MTVNEVDNLEDKKPSAFTLEAFFEQNGFNWRAGDLFFAGGGALLTKLKDFVRILGAFHDDQGHTPFDQIIVVTPPGAAASLRGYEKAINRKVDESSMRTPGAKDKSPWLQVREAPDLRISAVLSALAGITAQSGVIVLAAARFRKTGPTSEDSQFNLREDVWVPHIHALCGDLVRLVEDTQSYFVVDAGEFKPGRNSNLELLKSLDKVGIVSSEGKENGEAILAERLQAWDQYLAVGTLGPIFQEIDALPLEAEEKAFFRIQMFHRAGLYGQALKEIEQFSPDSDFSALMLCKLARIAADAGATFLAAQFLRPAIEQLSTIEGLALAIDIASELSERHLEEVAAARLERFIPEHPSLINRQLKKLDDDDDYSGLARLWGRLGNTTAQQLCLALAELLTSEGVADYAGIRKALVREFDSWQVDSMLVRHARRRKLYMHALDIATAGKIERPAAAHFILNIVEDLSLSRDEQDRLVISGNQLKTAIEMVITYLADNPTDSHTRSRLARVLSLEVTGTVGMALIAVIALDFMRRPLTPISIDRPEGLSPEQLSDKLDVIKNAWNWLDSQSPIMFGRTVLPESLLTVPADDLAPTVITMMKYIIGRIQDEGDFKHLRLWMMLGAAINPHTSARDYDLQVLRLGAVAFAMTGQVQFARDVAEQVLNLSDTPRRRRTAWFSVADVYQRLGDRMESLIAFACAAAGDTEVEGDEAWSEANGLVRLLRDIGLFDAAREVHAAAWHILEGLGLAEANAHRQKFMSLTLDLGQARLKDGFPSELPRFLSRATECAKEELEARGDVEPQAVLLAQLILWSQLANKDVPAETIEIFETLLKEANAPIARLAKSLSSANPEPEALLNLHHTTEEARYADDVAHDGRFLALLSQRLLASEKAADVAISTFAVEMISDKAVPAPGWKITSRPLPKIADIEHPAAIAEALSLSGTSVVLLGSDAEKHISHVHWENGGGSVWKEPADVFSLQDFRIWSEKFPYEYGIDDDTPNLFYTSTESLRLSSLPAGPIVVVADTELQQFPCNILRVGDEFAGESRPMASAPSLSWLEATRDNPAQTDGRKIAWISQEERLGQTFVAIRARLADTLEEHGIALDTGPEIPEGLAGSELVIVTAHGGLGSDRKYFQRVSDEGSLVASGGHLAAHLRNVGVVILFVCSGGRTDKVPDAVTTIGLAKELLNQGCTAVLASPWPLDSRVTYHWLPAFLEAWTRGGTLAEANFHANKAVAKGLGGEPAKCLAMTLYGDPLRTYLQATLGAG